jgi:hypothetical protein
MKTLLFSNLVAALLLLTSNAYSQTPGLVFKDQQLISGTNNQQGAVYLFKGVKAGVNATVRIDSLIGGAQVTKLDDNTGGLGYLNAWQPEIFIPAGTGSPYVLFTVNFIDSLTGLPKLMSSVEATAVDVDGNLFLKETVEINMGGGTASFMSLTLDISVIQLLFSKFKGQNLLGIERTNIDTSALGNMFTVTRGNINTYSVKIGANTLLSGSANRQYSLYMKGFTYTNPTTLPIKFHTFTATMNGDSKVDLKWTTASEINVSHFVIEKSLDGKNYGDAGIVFAYGNSHDQTDYAFVDNINGSKAGVIYYKIRSVDNDEHYKHSVTRVIRVGKEEENTISLRAYPNPVTSELRVTIPSKWQNKNVVYELYHSNGQMARKIETARSSQTENLNVNGLASGLYIVKVSCEGEIAQQKIIKN